MADLVDKKSKSHYENTDLVDEKTDLVDEKTDLVDERAI